jgi:membrane protease YdiL (CAAX protease family)
MAQAATQALDNENVAPARSKRRIFIELAITYGLILLVIWTPRPWQKHLWWVAAAAVVIIAASSFTGLWPLGLRTANFFQSIWIAGAALFLSSVAIVVAVQLHTLHLPNGGVTAFVKTYWVYALWACVQQLLLQGFFLPRFMGLTKNSRNAALLAGVLFALAHLPNPILTPVTLVWGLAACLLFLRYRNLYPLAIAHAIVGIAITITIPGHVSHNMRVGLGYLTYHNPTHSPTNLPKP